MSVIFKFMYGSGCNLIGVIFTEKELLSFGKRMTKGKALDSDFMIVCVMGCDWINMKILW